MKRTHRILDLGTIVGTGHRLGMDDVQRSTHLHIIGASGSGKSKLIEDIVRQDMIARRGLCLIDPHGELAQNLLAWASVLPIPPRRFHYIQPSCDVWSPCYNPLRLGTGETDAWFRLNAMKISTVKVWGADNTQNTPRLDEWLTNAFYTALTLKLTLPEVGMLLEPVVDRNVQRRAVAERLPEDASRIRSAWLDLCQLVEKQKSVEFEALVGSTTRRLSAFLDNPRLRRIFGVPDKSIDLVQEMDEGAVILVDLSTQGRLHPEDARLFGTLLLADFYVAMFSRERRERPFSLIVDEFQNYATKDLARMLDEARKFGVRLVLAHQRPGQLQTSDDPQDRDVYSAVLTNARSRVCFGGVHPDELEPIARAMSMNVLDPKKVKESLHTRGVLDYVKEYWEVHSHGTSQAHASASGGSSGSGWASSSASGSAAAATFDPNGTPIGAQRLFTSESHSWQQAFSHNQFSGSSWTESSSDSESHSVTNMPVLVPVMGEQLSTLYYETLEEQLFQFIAVLYDQKQRQAMVRLAGQKEPVPIETPFVRDYFASERSVKRQLAEAASGSSWFLPAPEALECVSQQRRAFLAMGQPATKVKPRVVEQATASRQDEGPRAKVHTTPPMRDAPTSSLQSEAEIALGSTKLGSRDIDLLVDLYDTRFTSIPHAALLCFAGDGVRDPAGYARKRLKQLSAEGLLLAKDGVFGRAHLPDGKTPEVRRIYVFTKEAYDLLSQRAGRLPEMSADLWDRKVRKRFDFASKKSASTIAHELCVLDVKTAFHVATEKYVNWRLHEFGVWPAKYEFPTLVGGRETIQKPDGFIHLVELPLRGDEPQHRYFFLELDRGTEQLQILLDKVQGYLRHYKQGGFLRWLNAPAGSKVRDHPFRVLIATDEKASRRRDNIRKVLAEAGYRKFVLLATLSDLVRDPYGPVWFQPDLDEPRPLVESPPPSIDGGGDGKESP